MKDLDDLSICKRIAEIEGIEVHEDSSTLSGFSLLNSDSYEVYNPLTDDGLNCRLRDTFEVCVHYGSGDVFICGGDNFDGCISVKTFDVDDKSTLKRAVLLCIISAHKGL